MAFTLTVFAFIFVIGLVIGSFLNVVILRTVSEESIVFPASKCPKCQTPLKWYHNIPVLSYLFLRGKCAFCKEHISIQYPIVELLTGVLFVALFIRFCNPIDEFFGLEVMNPISWVQFAMYIFSLIVVSLFIAIAGTDILEKKVANVHTYSLIGVGILYSIVYSVLSIVFYTNINGFPKIDLDFILTCPILITLAAAIMGFLLIEAVARLGIAFVGARTFGEGDSYISAGIGAVLGALFTSSPLYSGFVPVLQALLLVLIGSGVIQLFVTMPLFIKKLVVSKNWITLGALSCFVIYTIGYFFAQNLGWLNYPVAYWTSTLVLVAIGLFACRELICGLKRNDAADGLYLPFGPAMVASALIALFLFIF
jgi:leader peptidase (prepilin peptidase)/N-methyltransferase